MPRSRRNNNSNNEESNNSKSVPYTYSKELEKAASQALLEAVTGAVDDDATSNNSKRHFLNLFHLHCQSNAHRPVDINDEDLSAREQRQLLFLCLSKRFTDGQAAQFFAALHSMVEACVENQQHVPESAFEVDDNQDDHENGESEEHEIVPDAASAASLSFLQYAALCVSTYFQEHNNNNNRKGISSSTAAAAIPLFDTALALHNCLDQLEDPSWGPECVAAHAAIVALCETWWTRDGPHREQLIAQALPPLVENVLDVSTTNNSNKAALKRLYNLRTALTVIDFDDAASDAFAHLLLRLASQPHALKSAEGQRLLSFLLWEIPALRPRLHQALRAQIPNNHSVTVLRGVGEIYFGAWSLGAAAAASDNNYNGNDAAREQLLALEQDTLQELVYTAIHGSHASLVQNLRETVLAKFHDAKTKARGQALLQRLYGPILWRGLAAANAAVRVQAAHALAAVFPLSVTDRNPVRQGVTALQQLLQDADPRVRCAGSQAVAAILATYWDVVPAKDIRVLLNHLVAEHASDATSAPVRAGALNAVTILLEAPQSIAVLRDLLPSLGNLIHDKVEKVRLAAVRMLLRLKKTSGIKYYHVVPLEHLNARLAEEGKANPTNSVAAALTGLMVNSYFPVGQNVDPAEQIRRTLKFLTEDPDAAVVLYANIYKFRPVDAVAQLCVKLLRCLHSAIEKDRQREAKAQSTKSGKRRRHRVECEDDNDTASGGEPFPSALMASLAETVGILWDSIETDLEDDEEWNDFVVGEFSGATLTDILSYCEDTAAKADGMDDENEAEYIRRDCSVTTAAILRCAGRLPAKAVEGLVPHIASLMSSIQPPCEDDDDTPTENITSHVALLCSWGMTEEVASSLASSINSGFKEDDLLLGSPVQNSKKRRSRRSGSNTFGATASSVSVPALPAIAAVNVLSEILRGSDPSTMSAREAIMSCEKAVNSLEQILGAGLKHAENILSGESAAESAYASFLLQVCEAFGRFALHKEAFVNGTDITFNEQATTLMHWTTENLIPSFKAAGVPFVDPNISSIHFENSFAASFPASPEPIRRGGRRANLNRTPERLDEGLDMFEGSPSDVEVAQSAARVKRAFALSLMKNSCAIFFDWLSVGDSGAAYIAQASTEQWCNVFKSCDKSADLLTALGPDFWRLAVQLAKTGEEFGLLKRLLSCFHEGTEQIDNDISTMVRKSLSLLFSNRGPQADAIVKKTVNCAVEAAYEQMNQQGDELEYQLPISLGELWRSDVGCIGSALMAILTNKQASLELARQLSEDRFPEHVRDESTIQLALFDAKCLSLLCDGDSKVTQEASALARKLGEVGLNSNQELGSVVEELIDGLPAEK